MKFTKGAIEVFVENEAGSDQKNCFDEQTLEYIKTVTVSRKYPYPYGFLPQTTSGDGDNLDCFIITKRVLKSQEEVTVEPVGLMEQFEDGVADPKLLTIFPDEGLAITQETRVELTDFVVHAFDHKRTKEIRVGGFYGKKEAEELIKDSLL